MTSIQDWCIRTRCCRDSTEFSPELADAPGGSVVYWHVDDVAAALERLVSRGAKVLEPRTERGPGFVTASVVDPFGNVLGIMYNQHYLDVLASRAGFQ
ncbi:VOC family protein [Saccharopolyspora sp. NPDC050389]|uniref:VOC family protein n=1 Tax=Saccharopolyspora sp. NPDC050389 TaxID=3155516 RepID=UPI0033E6DA45